MVMPFVDAESLYFILSIIGLAGVGIMFIWRSGRKFESLESGNTQNHQCILKLEKKFDDHKDHVDHIAEDMQQELKHINDSIVSLTARSKYADELHDKIWDLLVKEVNKEKIPLNDNIKVEKLPSDQGSV